MKSENSNKQKKLLLASSDKRESTSGPDPGLISPLRFLIITLGVIFLAETLVMIVVTLGPPTPAVFTVLLDAGIITILVFPILYLLSFKPLLRYIEKNQQAEDALLHSMELQERFFDSIDTLIAYMDRDFNFIRVNEAYAKAGGHPPRQLIGIDWRSSTPRSLNCSTPP